MNTYRRRSRSSHRIESLEARAMLTSLTLIEDTNSQSLASNPSSLHAHGQSIFFTARYLQFSDVVFKTDGTPSGTGPVLTESGEMIQTYSDFPFETYGAELYISATPTSRVGAGLWRLDDSAPHVQPWISCAEMGISEFQDTLYGFNQEGLWELDTVSKNATPVSDLSFSDNVATTPLAVLSTGISEDLGEELYLWEGDGSPGSLMDLVPGPQSSSPHNFVELHDEVFFTALDADGNHGIWRTDGREVSLFAPPTPQNQRVLGATSALILTIDSYGLVKSYTLEGGHVETWSIRAELPPYTPGDEKLVFGASSTVFATDGTSEGTGVLRSIPDDGYFYAGTGFLRDSPLGVVAGVAELWVEQTDQIIDVNPATESGNADNMQALGTEIVFTARRQEPTDEGQVRPRVYVTDGEVIEKLSDRWGSSPYEEFRSVAVSGSLAYLSALHEDGSWHVVTTDGVSLGQSLLHAESEFYVFPTDTGTTAIAGAHAWSLNADGMFESLEGSLDGSVTSTLDHGVILASDYNGATATYSFLGADGLVRIGEGFSSLHGASGRRVLLSRPDGSVVTTDGTKAGTVRLGTGTYADRSATNPYVYDTAETSDTYFVLVNLGSHTELRSYDIRSMSLRNALQVNGASLSTAGEYAFVYDFGGTTETDGTYANTRQVNGLRIQDAGAVGDRVFVTAYEESTRQLATFERAGDEWAKVSTDVWVGEIVSAGGRAVTMANSYRYGSELFRLDLSPGFQATQSPELAEGSISDATAFLLSKPSENVVLKVAVSDPSQASAVRSLTFTPENWFVPQSLELEALADDEFDSTALTVTVSVDEASSATEYHDLPEFQQAVEIIDTTIGAYRRSATVYVIGRDDDDQIRVSTDDDEVVTRVGDRIQRFPLSKSKRVVIQSAAGDDDIAVTGIEARVFSGDGDDAISTGSAADKIYAGPGDDMIRSGSGPDSVFGNAGDDTVYAGSGRDLVAGGGDSDVLFGSNGSDTLNGGRGHDILSGQAGNDRLGGSTGHDIAIGGIGRDRINSGRGQDLLIAGRSTSEASYVDLRLIQAEWIAKHDQAARIANILDGTGNQNPLNKPVFQSRNEEIFSDNAEDTLVGSTGIDWFFAVDSEDLFDDLDADTETLS